jgi:hypothetical protein
MNTKPEHEFETLDGAHPSPSQCLLKRWLERAAEGSLAVSLMIHGLIVMIALLIVWRAQAPDNPGEIDISAAGGGGGSKAHQEVHENKLRLMLRLHRTPIVSGTHSVIALPNVQTSLPGSTMVTVSSGAMNGGPGTGGKWSSGTDGGYGSRTGVNKGPGEGKFGGAFFGALSSGNNIIICIDMSGSMRVNLKDAGIAALRRELTKVITDLPPAVSFNLICFSQAADLFKPRSEPATPLMKKEALRFLEGYYGGANADFGRTRTETHGRKGTDGNGIEYTPLLSADIEELAGTEGGSRIDLAMVAAFERNPTTLFVLSDGAPGTRKSGSDTLMDKDAIIELIREKQREVMGPKNKLLVNTLSIHSDTEEGKEGEKFLRKLAQTFGGKHRDVKPDRLK